MKSRFSFIKPRLLPFVSLCTIKTVKQNCIIEYSYHKEGKYELARDFNAQPINFRYLILSYTLIPHYEHTVHLQE